MRIAIALLPLLLINCGPKDAADWRRGVIPKQYNEHYYDGYGINDEFVPYITDFPSNMMIGMPIVFDDEVEKRSGKETTVGLCFSWTDGWREIGIDTDFWDDASYLRRKALLWHELGHCVLGLDHDDKLTAGMSNSLMSTSLMSNYMVRMTCKYNVNLDKLTKTFCNLTRERL